VLPGFGMALFFFGLFTVVSIAAFFTAVSVIRQLASVGWAVSVAVLILYVIAYAWMTFGFWWTLTVLWITLCAVLLMFRLV